MAKSFFSADERRHGQTYSEEAQRWVIGQHKKDQAAIKLLGQRG